VGSLLTQQLLSAWHVRDVHSDRRAVNGVNAAPAGRLAQCRFIPPRRCNMISPHFPLLPPIPPKPRRSPPWGQRRVCVPFWQPCAKLPPTPVAARSSPSVQPSPLLLPLLFAALLPLHAAALPLLLGVSPARLPPVDAKDGAAAAMIIRGVVDSYLLTCKAWAQPKHPVGRPGASIAHDTHKSF
jgi:hypothetical protein